MSAPRELEFTDQFAQAFAAMEGDKNLFITGKAGTGKSTLLGYFIENSKKEFAVLAPTGVAALNVGGETIHSFFRFVPGITRDAAREKGKKAGKKGLYGQISTIVIDEVSMVRADLMDCVDAFLRAARGSKKPFGGVQMIFIGDLYQLPPVVTPPEREYFVKTYPSPWFFDAFAFCEGGFSMDFIELEKIYRQTDEQFIGLLNAIRTNTVDEHHLEKLNKRVGERIAADSIRLTATNALADEVNKFRLARLAGKAHVFKSEFSGAFDIKQLPTDERLALKLDARVMFVNNDSAGRWVNGSLGSVARIHGESIEVALPQGGRVEVAPYCWKLGRYVFDKKTRTLEQETAGSFTQIPVRLAWAITIHKSQGKTFDNVTIDLGRGSFASGQTYVALSRCRTFGGISLSAPVKKTDIRIDFRVQKFITQFQYAISERACPLDTKVEMLKKAMEQGTALEITYLKAKDVKSRRRIKPLDVGIHEYEGKKFMGVSAWCLLRNEERVFRVDRILEIKM